jgi:hypothetical protein
MRRQDRERQKTYLAICVSVLADELGITLDEAMDLMTKKLDALAHA